AKWNGTPIAGNPTFDVPVELKLALTPAPDSENHCNSSGPSMSNCHATLAASVSPDAPTYAICAFDGAERRTASTCTVTSPKIVSEASLTERPTTPPVMPTTPGHTCLYASAPVNTDNVSPLPLESLSVPLK